MPIENDRSQRISDDEDADDDNYTQRMRSNEKAAGVEATVKRLHNDRVEEAKAVIAETTSQLQTQSMEEHKQINTWLQKHMDKFKAAGDEIEQISDAIITLERRLKAVQVAVEKRMVVLQHGRCESLATKERRIELAASILYQKLVDYAAATTTRTNIWTPNDDAIDTMFDSIDNNDGERKDILDAVLRLQTKQSVEKQQSEQETQKHRDEFTPHDLYTIHEELPQKTESTNAIQANNDKEDAEYYEYNGAGGGASAGGGEGEGKGKGKGKGGRGRGRGRGSGSGKGKGKR